MTHEYSASTLFTDPKNITVGNARVIWARATDILPEGWVLPGGRRVQSFVEAHAAACRMNDVANGKSS
jgi:hypothetical protein